MHTKHKNSIFRKDVGKKAGLTVVAHYAISLVHLTRNLKLQYLTFHKYCKLEPFLIAKESRSWFVSLLRYKSLGTIKINRVIEYETVDYANCCYGSKLVVVCVTYWWTWSNELFYLLTYNYKSCEGYEGRGGCQLYIVEEWGLRWGQYILD